MTILVQNGDGEDKGSGGHTFQPRRGGGGRSGGRGGGGGGRLDGEGGLPAARRGSQHPGAFEGDHRPRRGGHPAVVVKEPEEMGHLEYYISLSTLIAHNQCLVLYGIAYSNTSIIFSHREPI